jgi:hypothetical protein
LRVGCQTVDAEFAVASPDGKSAGRSRPAILKVSSQCGYLREMKYKDNRLEEETISYPRGKGTITYEYFPDGVHLKSAKLEDNFYDKRERIALFDQAVSLR